MNRETWSVVICAYTFDRLPLTKRAVDSVLAQTHSAREIVVVCDHNPALAAALAEAYAGRVTVLENSGPRGLSGARNTGLTHVNTERIAFLDDDAWAEPTWLASLDRRMTPGTVGVGGMVLPVWERGAPPAWMPEEFLWVVGCSYLGLPTSSAVIRNPIGANMGLSREVALEAGGFSPLLGRTATEAAGCEETDLAIRMSRFGGVHIYVPEAVVHHHVGTSRSRFAYFRRRCWAEGRSKAVLGAANGVSTATSAERDYLLRTLGPGFARRLRRAATGDIAALSQLGALLAGLTITAAGFAFASAARVLRRFFPDPSQVLATSPSIPNPLKRVGS